MSGPVPRNVISGAATWGVYAWLLLGLLLLLLGLIFLALRRLKNTISSWSPCRSEAEVRAASSRRGAPPSLGGAPDAGSRAAAEKEAPRDGAGRGF
ncbi:serine-rich and transmembrane domain-containing protein 1 [Stigmatopora argus]